MCKGAGRGVRDRKELASKHICSEAPESIIHVLVLKTARQVPVYWSMVPATALALISDVVAAALPICTCLIMFTNSDTCSLLKNWF